MGKVHACGQTHNLYTTAWGKFMVTLSFSKAIIAGLEQARTKAGELNNLRLYEIVQGLLWIGEGKSLEKVAQSC